LTYSLLDGVFPDSEQAVQYLRANYPWASSKFNVARMGVRDPGFASLGAPLGRVVVVSCSLAVAVKRLDLIARAVASAARSRPDLEFEWHHFGEGELLESVRQLATAILPNNAVANIPGYLGLDHLMRFYRDHPIDVFVNASASEGTPVSVMEAISCGIPVVATAAGGHVEIVSESNGVLVPVDASPEEIASAILRTGADKTTNVRLRRGSRDVWANNYDAATNYRTFAAKLAQMGITRNGT